MPQPSVECTTPDSRVDSGSQTGSQRRQTRLPPIQGLCLLRSGSQVRILPGAHCRARTCDVSGHRGHPEPSLGFGVFASAGRAWCSGRGSWWPAGGLVVPGGVDGQLAEQFAGGGVDDADMQILDEHQDAGPGVGPADADVVQLPADAQGELAVGVDAVGADPVVGVGGAVAGGGLGPGGVGGGGGGPVRQGAVRPLGVVGAGEGVEQGLQLGQGSGLGWLGTEPFLQRLLEPFDFPLGLGSGFGLPFFCLTPRRRSSASRWLRPPLPPDRRVVKTMPYRSAPPTAPRRSASRR